MGLVVNHNIPALQAFNALTMTTNALQKSIQKLSTGLRINSAADDAAGLAISEKMRAQIRGLDRAVMNSQDGISLIQTAEGALIETHSILQRMRELSIQAANDTLTQQDRAYIQLEIDQLREEVTRIGNTTQFNKKKLLDGSAAVLWSAGDGYTKAIVNGGLRTIDQFGQKNSAEGNYKINVTALNGNGEVKKSDIFKIKHERTLTFVLGAAGSRVTVNGVGTTISGATSVVGTNLVNGTYSVTGAAGTIAGVARATVSYGSSVFQGTAIGGTGSTTAGLAGASVLVEVLGVNSVSGVTSVRVVANLVTLDGTSRTVEKNYTTSSFPSELKDLDAALNGFTFDGTLLQSGARVGDKAAFSLTGAPSALATSLVTITAATAGAGYTYNVSDDVKGKTVNFIVYAKDTETGDLTNSKITITFSPDYGKDVYASGVYAFDASVTQENKETLAWGLIGDTVNERVKLSDIDKFWNSEGRFLIKDPQTLTITQGDGRQASITLYANDTMGILIEKLNKAIGQGLGQGQYTLDQKFARYGNGAISSAAPNALAARGTIVISSVVTGAAGSLSFAGDEDVLKALSLNVIKEAKETDYRIQISDAHTNNILVDGVQVTGNKLVGLVHPNVDVIFDPMLGISAKMDDNGYYKYTFNAKGAALYLHLADNTTVFQIGANEGEDMGINIGDMRSTALGLDAVLVTDRASAARSITIIDNAIDKVSMQRAKLGAYQNRLEHTINNLSVAAENLTASESRIRDTDMAKEMMNFTKLQIMLQAGTSMLAQANMIPQNVLSLLR